MKGLFLDRDGVINDDVGYGHRIDQMRFLPGVFELLAQAKARSYRVMVVTNQGGIARGLYSETQFQHLTAWMRGEVARLGGWLDAVYHCPHHPEGIVSGLNVECLCRKPSPGMIERGLSAFNLDPKQCVMVGDRATDMDAASTAGLTNLYQTPLDRDWEPVSAELAARVQHVRTLHEVRLP